MVDPRLCPQCGNRLEVGTSPALCPRCLIDLGLELHVGGRATPPDTTDSRDDATLPHRIGRYRILAKMGEGGMGVVYEAEQANPKRKVAVKVVRGGQFIDDARVLMFQREVDTLARLKHPSIGAIYESGRSEDNQHFFAMELVRGRTLDAYMKQRPHAKTREELRFRLALFRKIADAVHYAHQRGVIHRDLKPRNIVVTEEASRDSGSLSSSSTSNERLPEVKILDFGLARITGGDVAATTMATDVGVIKGTLPYMSPEQARGNPDEIDVRTDVYALGVMLYEMLSGQRPYDVTTAALADAVRIICDEPPRALRQSIPDSRALDPDIGTIVFKALEKEADRRYASAAALAEDVTRYLTSQPILARPPSTLYQLRKFTERNGALVGGIAATFVVLVAGAILSTVLGIREAAQRRTAERAKADLESVVEFQAGMLAEMDTAGVGGRLIADLRGRVGEAHRERGLPDAEARTAMNAFDRLVAGVSATDAALRLIDEEILARAVDTMQEQFSDRPLIEATLRNRIGRTYQELGLYDRARPHVEAALATRTRLLGRDHPETLESIENMALLTWARGEFDEAEPYLREVLRGRRRALGDDHPDTLTAISNLGWLLEQRGKFEEAEPLLREALAGRRSVLGADHRDTVTSINAMGVLLWSRGKLDEAEQYFREAVEGSRRALGDDHPDTLGAIGNMAGLLASRARLAEAEPYFREAVGGFRRVLGNDHRSTLTAINNMGWVLLARGKLGEAEPYLHEALEARRRVLGDDHAETLDSIDNMGRLLKRQGKLEEAEPYFREAVEGSRRVLGDDHPKTLSSIDSLGLLLESDGELEQAEPYFREAVEGRRRVLGSDHPHTLTSIYHLACLVARKGGREEALDLVREAVSLGWASPDILTNENLDSLRGDPEFEALVLEVEQRLDQD